MLLTILFSIVEPELAYDQPILLTEPTPGHIEYTDLLDIF